MSHYFDGRVSPNGDAQPASEPEPSEPRPTDGVAEETPVGTPSEVKEVTQELLKFGFIEEARKPAFFRRAVVYEREIAAALQPLDFVLRLDSHRGVAFLAVDQTAAPRAEDPLADDLGAWSHPLVRRQRLTLEQSLLVAILRQRFVMHEQESGVGQSGAKIAVDELLPHFLTYFEDTSSDARNESRLLNLLDQLKTYGIVSEVDKRQEVTIRPLIAHLANPESLAALLTELQDRLEAERVPSTEATGQGSA